MRRRQLHAIAQYFERIHRFARTDERENSEARPLLRVYCEQLNSLEREIIRLDRDPRGSNSV